MEGAVRAYNRILEADPTDEEVLLALETLYRARARYPELLSVLRRKAELTNDAQFKEELLVQMADVHREQLGEPQEAIARYREILELDPSSARALGALDALYEQQSMWAELADNVGRQLDLADDPQHQVAFMLRLAALRERRMGAVEGAIAIYSEVLSREPDNAEALSSLERLMQSPDHEFRSQRFSSRCTRRRAIREIDLRSRDPGAARRLSGAARTAAAHDSGAVRDAAR